MSCELAVGFAAIGLLAAIGHPVGAVTFVAHATRKREIGINGVRGIAI